MKAKELTLLKELVHMAFNFELSHCCDDFDVQLLAKFDPSEIAELSFQFGYYNGDPENYEEDRFIRVGMTAAGMFLFDKLTQMAEGEKNQDTERLNWLIISSNEHEIDWLSQGAFDDAAALVTSENDDVCQYMRDAIDVMRGAK